MLEYKVEAHGIEEIKKQLDDVQKKQLPFATKEAINATSTEIKVALEKEIGKVFDQPTPWTLNSLRIRYATKALLSGLVWVKDKLDSGKGTPADEYLIAEIKGGKRPLKKFEKALRRVGILPDGMYAVPGKFADMDSYGNMSRAQIIQIISYFQAFGEQGYKANMNEKGFKRLLKGNKKQGIMGYSYIIGGKGRAAHLPPGIYKRIPFASGSAIRPVLMFVKEPSYSMRFDFFGIADKIAKARFVTIFKKKLAEALRTARP